MLRSQNEARDAIKTDKPDDTRVPYEPPRPVHHEFPEAPLMSDIKAAHTRYGKSPIAAQEKAEEARVQRLREKEAREKGKEAEKEAAKAARRNPMPDKVSLAMILDDPKKAVQEPEAVPELSADFRAQLGAVFADSMHHCERWMLALAQEYHGELPPVYRALKGNAVDGDFIVGCRALCLVALYRLAETIDAETPCSLLSTPDAS